jgi:hypothetical protein
MRAIQLCLAVLGVAASAGVLLAAAAAPTPTSTAAPALAPPASTTSAGFAFKDTPGKFLDVLLDGRMVARYVYEFDDSTKARREETYKPFLHVADPEGKGFITKGVGGMDTHHRGIYIGWQAIQWKDKKEINLWEMPSGNQVHQKFSARKVEADLATFTAVVAWKLLDGTQILEEQRTFTFRRPAAPALVVIDVASKLTAVGGDLVLEGNPEHGGIQYRAVDVKEGLDKSVTKYLLPKDGAATDWTAGSPTVTAKLVDLPWAAMAYVIKDSAGKEAGYCVQEMSSAGNPKGTLWSAYRDYARFGACPKLEVKEGQSATVRYRFCVTGGKTPTADELRARYDEFVGRS